MLPLKLTIQGFYSYQEPQVIDFARLTEAGLFGIFGAVGSGKSSILEAISFVLYGATERLDSGDRRAYNMLNLKSDKALIDFEFCTAVDELYRFSATWKRRKKDYAATSTIERTACKWKDGEWLPLESANAEQVLGLKYDNFKRTIIIPQGKFKEFLELTKGDRVKMLKEIFNLYQYDFAEPAKQLTARNNEALHHNAGILSQYTLYSQELLQEKKDARTLLQEQVQESRSAADHVQQRFDRLLRIKEAQMQLQQAREELNRLESRKEEYEMRASRIGEYDKAVLHVKSLLEQQELHRKSYIEARGQEQQVLALQQEAEQAWSTQQDILSAVTQDYAQLETRKQKAGSVQYIIDHRTRAEEYAQLQERITKGAAHVAQVSEQKAALLATIQDADLRMVALRAAKPATDVLLQATEWFARQDQLQGEHRNLQQQTDKIQQLIQEQEQYLLQWNVPPEDCLHFLDVHIEKSLQSLAEHTLQWQQAQVQVELQRYRTELEPGMPCPLCGSTTHQPELHEDHESAGLEIIRQQKEAIEQQLQQWREHRTEALRRLQVLEQQQEQLRATDMDQQAIQSTIEGHRLAFTWEGIFVREDRTSLQSYQQSILKAEQDISSLEAELTTLRQTEQSLTEQQQKYQQAVIQFQIQAQQIMGRMEVLEQQIVPQHRDEWAVYSVEELRQMEERYRKEISTTEQRFAAETERSQQLREERASLQARLEQLRQQVNQSAALQEQGQTAITEVLKEQGFADEETVWRLLQLKDMQEEKQVVEHFFRALHAATIQLTTRQEQAGSELLDEQEYEQVAAQRIIMQDALKEQQERLLLLDKEVLQWIQKLEEKQVFETKEAALQARAINLKTMTGLFQANGFVEYISEMYLQNLCTVANERFHRLTRNQLSLMYDPERGFEVMDYLNGGKTRSAKTLSGGQAFQASLCLALALADSIQSLNKFEKNFFFIDEGFGTLDKDSIDIVFQTLEQLYREHRVVGVISHVEELQERIPRYVQVMKDPERGSIVTLS